MSDDPVTYLDAAGAAAVVGVSVSGLRRLAPIFEQVYGELPRSGKGSGDSPRLWSPDAVSRLATARAAVESGRFKSVRIALEALQGVESTGDSLEAAQIGSQLTDRQVLEAVLKELVELRSEVELLRRERSLSAPVEVEPGASNEQPGLIVRLANGLDNWFKKWF